MPKSGRYSYVGYAKEDSRNTLKKAIKFLKFNGCSLKLDSSKITDDVNVGGFFTPDVFQGKQVVSGSITGITPNRNNIGDLLLMAGFKASDPTHVDGTTGVYKHVFTLNMDDDENLPYFSFEFYKLQYLSWFSGCRASSFKLDIDPDKLLKCDLDIVGCSETDSEDLNADKQNAVFDNEKPYRYYESFCKIAGEQIPAKKVNIEYTDGTEADYNMKYGIIPGSLDRSEGTLSGEIELNLNSTAEEIRKKYKEAQEGSLEIAYQTLDFIEATTKGEFKIEIPRFYYEDYSDDISGNGKVTAKAKFNALENLSGETITVTLINLVSQKYGG